METDTIDRLFLELAQFTSARTPREIALREENARLTAQITAMRAHIAALVMAIQAMPHALRWEYNLVEIVEHASSDSDCPDSVDTEV